MVNKITNWTPFYLELPPKTQLRDKVLINVWFVSECLWSNPKAPVCTIKDCKWIEKDTSTYCRTIQMATAIALAFILHKRPVLGGVLIALSAVPKGAIRYLAKNEISKLKQSPVEGTQCKATPYPQQEEGKLLVQDYVKVLPNGISIHFSGIDYGTHPEAQKGVHTKVFDAFSNKLAKMETLTEESCDEAVSTLYNTFATHIKSFEEKNTKTTKRISELLDNITTRPLTEEAFNELRGLLELEKLKIENSQGDDLKMLINALISNNYNSIAGLTFRGKYVSFFQRSMRTYKTYSQGEDPRDTPFGCAVFFKNGDKQYLYTASSDGVDYYIYHGTDLRKKANTKGLKLTNNGKPTNNPKESIEVQPGDTVIGLSGELAKGGAGTAQQILAGTFSNENKPGGFTVMRLRPDINT